MAGINMSYYIYMPAQLEKIQNEPDYRKKVDFAVDAIMAIYNEEQRLRHNQDSFSWKVIRILSKYNDKYFRFCT